MRLILSVLLCSISMHAMHRSEENDYDKALSALRDLNHQLRVQPALQNNTEFVKDYFIASTNVQLQKVLFEEEIANEVRSFYILKYLIPTCLIVSIGKKICDSFDGSNSLTTGDFEPELLAGSIWYGGWLLHRISIGLRKWWLLT